MVLVKFLAKRPFYTVRISICSRYCQSYYNVHLSIIVIEIYFENLKGMCR